MAIDNYDADGDDEHDNHSIDNSEEEEFQMSNAEELWSSDNNDKAGNYYNLLNSDDGEKEERNIVEQLREIGDGGGKESQCGWGRWKPQWAQVFNNPKGYLILLSFQGLMQGMIAFGFLYVVISTLEKRFNFSSTTTGLLASCYDIAGTSVVIFVTYFGSRSGSKKPAWVGWGGLIFALGSILFSLPHFLTGDYNFEVGLFGIYLCIMSKKR